MRTIYLLVMTFLVASSCNQTKQQKETEVAMATAIEVPEHSARKNDTDSKTQLATFLTFQKGDAEQAMNYYSLLFENSEIVNIKRWGSEMGDKEGQIMHATFKLNGHLFMCSDSPAIHEWGFTPAVSNYVECVNEAELERLFANLSEGGQVFMPLNNYGFSTRFGFVEDKFGVSWQLNLR